MFRAMVYAPTEERYNSAKATFCERSKKRSKTLVTYFTKNWDSCSSMWSNYGRRFRFSGGNTTTNRIEASWNQFKQLLGKKTSIDKCVRVVIQQQVAVMRQIVSSLTQFEVNPPPDNWSPPCPPTTRQRSEPVLLGTHAAAVGPARVARWALELVAGRRGVFCIAGE